MKYVLIVWLALFFVGCGADAERKREDAILSGQIFLDKLQCQQAIEVLEEAGRDSLNVVYMKTLASAYACRAGYNTPSFFTDDLPNISNSGSVIGSLTTLTNASSNNAPDNDSFDDLQTAIDLLLYAGGLDSAKDPTIQRRAIAMKADEAEEVNAYLLFLILDQMGRYFYHYGDADSNGVKGGRDSGGNECLANYRMTYRTSSPIVDLGIMANTPLSKVLEYFGSNPLTVSGECGDKTDNDGDGLEDEGHPDFGILNGLNYQRLCQGVVLWNNFRALLPEVLSNVAGDDFDSLDGLSALLDTQVGYLEEAIPLSTAYSSRVLSQTKCVTDNEAYGQTEFLEWFFVFVFEPLFE